MKTVITASSLLTPTAVVEFPVITVEDGCVLSAHSASEAESPGSAKIFDFPGMILAPGLIDIHVHGGAGHDVMETNDSALSRIQESMAKHGITSYLPTTVTAPQDKILLALEHLSHAIKNNNHLSGARPLGIHLEGPFISHAKCGVHPVESLVDPSVELLDRYWQASGGTLSMITIAPELPGALAAIAHAKTLGVHSSLGHSNATYQETSKGIAAGAVHATHTFNAMRPLDHREPGILGAVLSDERVSADIIVDGIHVDPAVVKMFFAAKGIERSILITDAISATGRGDGIYKLGTFDVTVTGERCEHEGKLAGSVLTLDRAIRNTMRFTEWTLQQTIRLATLNPARLLGLSGKGRIAPGCDADLVVLTPDGQVVETFVAGNACM